MFPKTHVVPERIRNPPFQPSASDSRRYSGCSLTDDQFQSNWQQITVESRLITGTLLTKRATLNHVQLHQSSKPRRNPFLFILNAALENVFDGEIGQSAGKQSVLCLYFMQEEGFNNNVLCLPSQPCCLRRCGGGGGGASRLP